MNTPTGNKWIANFENSLPMSLLIAREAVMSRFTPVLREYGLSPQQWRVMRVLVESSQAIDATELSKRCYLMMPSLTRILRSMEQRDLITRSPDKKDHRRLLVSITPSGKELHNELTPYNAARFADIERIVGREKLEQLHQLLSETISTLKQHS